MLSEIKNYIQMAEDVATSGQPSEAQFLAIAEEGYDAVINLAMPDSDTAITNEGSLVTKLGMTYIHIPVPFDAPDIHHLQRFLGIMDALLADKTAQETMPKVWVHCVVNYRVSAFVYHYLRTRRGLPDRACQSAILQAWLPKMEPVWQSFLALEPGQASA